MEDFTRTWGSCSNKDLSLVNRYKQRIRQIEDRQICQQIVNKPTNNLDFYKITPKQELPKYLQKMRFQTLHIKEKDIANSIQVFQKENAKPQEMQIRKKLKEEGHIMLLSEIYQHLGESCDYQHTSSHTDLKNSEQTNSLDEWQKLRRQQQFQMTKMFKRQRPIELRTSQMGDKEICRKQIDSTICRQLKSGADYSREISHALQIIEMTHSSETNTLNRYVLVENSSKLLKRELDQRKMQVEETIRSKMKLLFNARTDYHRLFDERHLVELEKITKDELAKEQVSRISHKSLGGVRNNELRCQKQGSEQNEENISKTKRVIESLEQTVSNLEEELHKIVLAETEYFKISLRNGNDVREGGLVWLIKALRISEDNIHFHEFPTFLDRKSRLFLVQKARGEEEEQQLLDEKRKFVNLIGKSTEAKFSRQSILVPKQIINNDRILEYDFNSTPVPKKYRRSLKKITLLTEQFIKNSALMTDLRDKQRKALQISADLQGLSNKQIYTQIGERIKRLDLSKMKKDKAGGKRTQLLEYQNLLQRIKDTHIRLEQMELQHENHLLTHYQQNKNLYFVQAAACFGYKRAYSMIIKHFSWKSYHEPPE